jgi:hypothetical protein
LDDCRSLIREAEISAEPRVDTSDLVTVSSQTSRPCCALPTLARPRTVHSPPRARMGLPRDQLEVRLGPLRVPETVGMELFRGRLATRPHKGVHHSVVIPWRARRIANPRSMGASSQPRNLQPMRSQWSTSTALSFSAHGASPCGSNDERSENAPSARFSAQSSEAGQFTPLRFGESAIDTFVKVPLGSRFLRHGRCVLGTTLGREQHVGPARRKVFVRPLQSAGRIATVLAVELNGRDGAPAHAHGAPWQATEAGAAFEPLLLVTADGPREFREFQVTNGTVANDVFSIAGGLPMGCEASAGALRGGVRAVSGDSHWGVGETS